ncbi:unnamed protein product [Rhizophagus irregularis]|uniref:Uncharacterized protein n=1 Tax=Rhizophagus irregularis TaxID=588596 RepID=A0A915YZT3_9GLOM|nr:unnamed protein product [Rhizophagus irregularis]CAB5355513.1 unnamed protein product [Rhizophagus irregularis]
MDFLDGAKTPVFYTERSSHHVFSYYPPSSCESSERAASPILIYRKCRKGHSDDDTAGILVKEALTSNFY